MLLETRWKAACKPQKGRPIATREAVITDTSRFREKEPMEQPGAEETRVLTEPATGIQVATRRNTWLVLLGKDLTDQFTPTAHPDFLENGLEVILDGIG
jgi:hypothetical protein